MDERVDLIEFIQILWIKVHMFMDADWMVNILVYRNQQYAALEFFFLLNVLYFILKNTMSKT